MGVKTGDGLKDYYKTKIEALNIQVRDKGTNLSRLQAQRNELNTRGASLRSARATPRDGPCEAMCTTTARPTRTSL